MKIAIFIQSLQGGGAERVSSHLANIWAEQGRDVTVITLTDTESDAYTLHPAVHRIGLNLAMESHGIASAVLANGRRICALRKILKQMDVVVAMMMTASILAVLASFGLKCRTVISERCYPPLIPVGRLWSTLRRIIYPLADCVVAQTQESSRWLQQHAGCKRVVVIPNPVVLPLSVGLPNLAPDSVLNPDRHVLLAVGRLCKEKGFDWLLQAFSRIAVVCPQWDLVIIGEGSLRNDLIRQRDNLKLTARIMLPGHAGNMADWYRRANLFVLTSRSEGFPNVLVEAMAHGCAVVSYDCYAGPRDIISDGVNGILVKPVGDVDGMARALLVLMTEEHTRKQFAQNAIAVQERFSMPGVLSLWEGVISAELTSG